MRQRNRLSLPRVAFHAAVARTSALTLGRRVLRGPRHPAWPLQFELAMALVETAPKYAGAEPPSHPALGQFVRSFTADSAETR